MKFCANLSFMFTDYPITKRYKLARDAGFMAVETGFPFGSEKEEIVNAKNESGVKQVLLNLKTGDVSKKELGITAIPGKEEEFKDNLRTTIDFAKALNCRKIHIMAGIVEQPSQSHWNTYKCNLKYAASELERVGLVGVIEPINHNTVPNYFLHDYNKAISVIDEINSSHLRLMLDIFHMQQICGNITKNLKEFMPYVGHVQIAQVPDRNEPDADGELNYRYILRQLESSGYDDYVGLEYKPTSKDLAWVNNFGYSL